MALYIKHSEADRLARELAEATGETLTDAVIQSLRERLLRARARSSKPRLLDELRAIRERCAALPVVDNRPSDEILGYGSGLPE